MRDFVWEIDAELLSVLEHQKAMFPMNDRPILTISRIGRRTMRFTCDRDMVLGRTSTSAVPLPDEQRGVSRQHARIGQDPAGVWQIEDLKSRNGTFLNGNPVERAQLHHGDVICAPSQNLNQSL